MKKFSLLSGCFCLLVIIIPHTFECVKEKIKLENARRIASEPAIFPAFFIQFQLSEE